MVELEPKNTADFINSKFFESNPKKANDFLNSALAIIEKDPDTDEDVVQAIKVIDSLGDCISVKLFDGHPILADKTLRVFMKGLYHEEECVKGQTIDKIRNIIINSCTDECTKLNERILRTLLGGFFPPYSKSTNVLIQKILAGDTKEIAQIL